jgi:hypothetical protein
MKAYWQIIQTRVRTDWRWQVGCIFILLLLVGVLRDGSQVDPPTRANVVELDQYTPPGHSLVPLHLANHEALLPLLGATALMNLFDGEKNRWIAKEIKVVRAPQAPDTLVAVVPDHLVAKVARSTESLVGVLQNPEGQSGTNFVYKKGSTQRPIYYGQESK